MFKWLTRSKAPTKPTPTLDIGMPEDGWLLPDTADNLLSTPLRQQLIQLIWHRTSLSKPLFTELYLNPIQKYAALVQRLPASESHHHAHLGGMLDHTLEVVCFAAKMRQTHLLPPSCPPEDQAKEAEAWTAAIVYAALLHDIGKTLVDMTVMTESGTRWHPWHGPLAEPYRLQYNPHRDYRLHPAAGAILCTHILPQAALNWLSEYQQLFSSLLYCIAGHYESAGIIGELIQKADQASVAQNMGGDASKALARPQSTLPKQIIAALRELVQNTLKLNNTKFGSDGWLTEEALWLVSKTASDKTRAWLLQHGITGVPDSNSRLFDEMQDHGIVLSNEGKAIWNCTVKSSSGWSPGVDLTLLRVSPSLIWEQIENRPPLFDGTVTPVVVVNSIPPLDNPSPNNSNNHPPEVNLEELTLSLFSSPEDPPAIVPFMPERIQPDRVDVPPQPSSFIQQAPISGRPQEKPTSSVAELPFLNWLKQGIMTKHLQINDVQAKIHVVNGSIFLVSPEIFKLFVKETTGSTGEEWREVQKVFQKQKIHRRGKDGINIWTCEVQGPRKTRKIKGYILETPTLLLGEESIIPDSNPYLTLIET
ncbi:TPA: TraI domain-containing protein [Yersinia enterocolitica]|nr:TraI domain-containing protein [Yersinia enterocolitica]